MNAPAFTLFRYIAMRALFGIGGLLLILLCLILLIDLIENLRFTGKVEDAGLPVAISLTLLRAPALAQTLIPFVFLFGSIWMFYQLNKRSELSVMRSAGLSVWRVLGPAALIAALSGLLIITIVDPVSSQMLSYAETLKNQKQGKTRDLVKVFRDGIWLRQRNDAAHVIINAQSHDRARGALVEVSVWRFSPESAFIERIDADEAVLAGATMELRGARITAPNDELRRAPVYALQTELTSDDLNERVQAPETISIWRLPRFIELAETAGLPTVRYQIRFHDLCATPLKLLAMVLIAAAFSMRPMRMGGQLQLVVLSIGAGFALYILSEISTALGESELAPVALAAWAPAVIAALAAGSVLLHLEDG
ncbi:MAG: LPS export ABC transporter permease LptG [Pseudomonadota bacterium]